MLSEQSFLVPRQVTSRFEFLPGWGLWEAGGAVAGLGLSYLVFKGLAQLGTPLKVQVLVASLPVAIAVAVTKGTKMITRWMLFLREQQRFFYRLGTGREAAARMGITVKGGEYQMLMAIFAMFKAKSKKAPPTSPAAQTAQGWLPVRDVQGGLIHRKDGQQVAVIRVESINLGLRSISEQGRIISSLHEAINSLQFPAQFLSVPRPLDLDAYVQGLEARMTEVDQTRQRLLRPYLRYMSNLVSGGEAQERRHYILVPRPSGKGSEEELQQMASELVARLRQADLNAYLLDDTELLSLLYVWSHPGQAAIEKAPSGPPSFTTLVEQGGEVTHGSAQAQAI